MAGKRIETEVAVSVTGEEKVEKLAKSMDKLEDTKLKVGVETDDRDVVKLIERVKQLGAKDAVITLGIEAGQAQNELNDLLLDLRKFDGTDAEAQVKIDKINETRADVDALSDEIKRLADENPEIKIDSTSAKQGIDEIGKSAESSKSVLANMVGNASQDLGELGGIAGSAGVALGQMGEYMADAAASGESMGSIISNFGKVAGPIAGIGIAVGVGISAWKAYREEQARVAKVTEDASKQLLDQTGIIEQLNAAVEATSLASLIPDEDISKATLALGGLGRTVKTFDDDVGQVVNNTEAFFSQLLQGEGVAKGTADEIAHLVNTTDHYSEALSIATNSGSGYSASTIKFLQDNKDRVQSLEDIQDSVEDLDFDQLNKDFDQNLFFSGTEAQVQAVVAALADYEQQTGHAATGSEELRIKQEALAAQMEKEAAATEASKASAEGRLKIYQDTIAQIEAEAAALQDAAFAWDAAAHMGESYASALEDINGASDVDFAKQAFKTVESFDTLKGALKDLKKGADDWRTVDLVPDSVEEFRGVSDEVKAVTEAIGGMRDAIQTELTGVISTQGIDEYSEKFDFFAQQVSDQYMKMFEDMGLSEEDARTKTNELLDELNLLPEDKEIQIKLTQEAQARAALETFRGVIETLPESKQIAINTAIAEGDIDTALTLLNTELIEKGYPPIEIGTSVNTSPGQAAFNEFMRNNSGRTIDVTVRPLIGKFDQGGIVGPDGGVAGENGPEILNGKFLTNGPTLVTAGTQVTSRASTASILAELQSQAPTAVTAGQPIVTNITNVITIPTADPSAMVRALQRWSRSNGALPISRGRG